MYDFSPLVQAGIAIGKYVPVKTAAGVPIGMVRDASTGRFVAHAVGMATNPLTAAPQLLMSGAQLYQGQQALQGIKVLQASVSALQATTALIGVGRGLSSNGTETYAKAETLSTVSFHS